MKISEVDVTVFAWDDIPVARYGQANPATSSRGEIGLLRIATDEGLEGHAFLGSSFRSVKLDVTSLVRHLKPVVIGRDPLERERLHADLLVRTRATTLRAIGAVDVALWDLCGKIAGLPLYKMLGAYRSRVPAYASSSTLANNEKALELKTGECCAGAPPVLEFDQAGNLLRHWGGPGQGYDWPSFEHGIHIDYKGFVWVGGNNCPARALPGLKPVGDDQLIKFDPEHSK